MGKLKTAYQSTAIEMLLWHYPLENPGVVCTLMCTAVG